MSKSYTGSPVPYRPATTDPIFSEGDDTYVVKAVTPMQHQRSVDGSLHSMDRVSALSPKGPDIFLSGDKIDKSGPETSVALETVYDVDAVIKSFMEE
jgi:hypothetical protein